MEDLLRNAKAIEKDALVIASAPIVSRKFFYVFDQYSGDEEFWTTDRARAEGFAAALQRKTTGAFYRIGTRVMEEPAYEEDRDCLPAPVMTVEAFDARAASGDPMSDVFKDYAPCDKDVDALFTELWAEHDRLSETAAPMSVAAFLDLIGEFGRTMFDLLDDSEDRGTEIVIDRADYEKAVRILDRIAAIFVASQGVPLGTGAKLQEIAKEALGREIVDLLSVVAPFPEARNALLAWREERKTRLGT